MRVNFTDYGQPALAPVGKLGSREFCCIYGSSRRTKYDSTAFGRSTFVDVYLLFVVRSSIAANDRNYFGARWRTRQGPSYPASK
jgi:hypothetical protein